MSDTPKTAAPTDSAPNIPAKQNNEAEYNANVPVDLISPDPKNRDKIDPARVDQLAENIADVGLLQPVVVRMMKDGQYQLIAGEHRWRAVKKLKLPTIAARIYRNQTELEAAKRKTAENALRVELTPIERAKRYQELQQLGASQKDIGSVCGGVSQPVVANALRLLTLPKSVQDLISNEELSEAHGVSLARFARWPKICARIATLAHNHSYGSKELNQEGIPFAGQLEQERLIEKIAIKDRFYSDGTIYSLPRHFNSHADFIVGEYVAYYFLPTDPKNNVWAPEKKKQDDERAAVAAAKAVKDSKQAKDGKLSKEAIQRRETIAKNKWIRADNSKAYFKACEQLRRIQAPTALLIGIIVEAAIAGGFHRKRIEQAAADVSVRLPKDIFMSTSSQGLRDLKELAGMDTIAVTRLAVAVLLNKQVDDANRGASQTPEAVRLINAAKVAPMKFQPSDVVGWGGPNGGEIQGTVLVHAGKPLPDSTPIRVTKGETPIGRIADIYTSALWLIERPEREAPMLAVEKRTMKPAASKAKKKARK